MLPRATPTTRGDNMRIVGSIILRAAAAALFTATAALAGELPRAKPESVGLSSPRLARISAVLKADIAAGKIPGAVLLIARHGKVAHFEALGKTDPAQAAPMPHDGIFRIYSMTKPITSVAVMMLVEEGRINLDHPLSMYLPEFAKMSVGVEKADADGKPVLELVPARRQITIQDLLRHSSGITYGFFGPGLVKKAYVDAALNANDPDNAEFSAALAKLPLAYQPGTTWDYSNSTDILGRVVEVVSGKTLFGFMRERILDPLGMKDTAFYVTDPALHPRLAEPFPADRTIGAGAVVNDPRKARRWESGGGGMVSTARDYARFLQMLLQKGSFEGRRYLSPATIDYMTADHLGTTVAPGPLYLPGPGYGFGLGFAVRRGTGEAPVPAAAGEYNWGGAGGTAMWVDPKNDMFVVFMMQAPSKRGHYRPLLRNMIYGSLLR
jgi:CubicO group peptidase (beta-lactamase class C family)